MVGTLDKLKRLYTCALYTRVLARVLTSTGKPPVDCTPARDDDDLEVEKRFAWLYKNAAAFCEPAVVAAFVNSRLLPSDDKYFDV